MRTDFDRQEQYERARSVLISGETLYGVYDLVDEPAGLLAISDLRLMFSVAGQVISLPYSRLRGIATVDDGQALIAGDAITFLAAGQSWTVRLAHAEKLPKAYKLIARNLLQQEASGLSLGL